MNSIFTQMRCVPQGAIRKILLVMRLTTFIIFAAFMQVSAAGIAQRLTLVQKNVTLKQLFSEINKQTGYSIIWSVSQVRGNVTVNADFKDTPLLEALDKSLENTNLTYTIESKTVVIREKDPTLVEKIRSALNLAITVSGKVVDETGQPMAGVTVKEKGTANGVVTDAKGMFLLTVADDKAVVVFSFVGFEGQELAAKDVASGAVTTMKAATNNLKEVVVNKGYYNEKRELSTGDAISIKADVIEKQPVGNVLSALIGRVPGLEISQSSGAPGAYFKTLIRGQNSIASGNDPLFIVDGVIFNSTPLSSLYFTSLPAGVTTSTLNGLNPSDIESVEVLKDADATAIYGSRGANGVILITTKKAKYGETKVDLNVYNGFGHITQVTPLLNLQQYLEMRHDAFRNDGVKNLPFTAYDLNGTWDTTRYTNWEKYFIGGTSHNLNTTGRLSGGNLTTQFLISSTYNKETTVFPGDFYDVKGSVHINLAHSSLDSKFKLNFTAFYSTDNNVMPQSDLSSLIRLSPDSPPLYDSNGDLNWQNSTWTNPISYLRQRSKSVTNNLISNLTLKYGLLRDLEIKCDFGFSKVQFSELNTTPQSSFNPALTFLQATANYANSDGESWSFEPQINYNKTLKNLKISALLGGTFTQQHQTSLAETGTGYTTDALIEDIQAASNVTVNGVGNSLYKYNAVFGRLNFILNDQFILNGTARRDGSSRFGANRQFSNFGAVGAGWLFSKLNFVRENFSILSYGKIRANYGITGNDQIGDYQYLEIYQSTGNTYQGSSNLNSAQLANPNFSWEINKKLEGGLDLGFFDDRIQLSASYFRNRSSNQLVGYSLPQITGFGSIIANLPATVQNTGVEFEINTVNLKANNWSWTSSFNLSIPRNKLISYPNIEASSYADRYIVGEPLSIRKAYLNTGVDKVSGVYTFYDYNGDGTISSPSDVQNIIFTGIKYSGGFGNTLSYKNLQIDIFLQFVDHPHATNYFGLFGRPGIRVNQPLFVLPNWQKPGDEVSVQEFTNAGAKASAAWSEAVNSNLAFSDASFVRFKNIAISYKLSQALIRSLKVKSCKIYLNAQNLFTISKYQGLDPETLGNLPPIKNIVFGIQAAL